MLWSRTTKPSASKLTAPVPPELTTPARLGHAYEFGAASWARLTSDLARLASDLTDAFPCDAGQIIFPRPRQQRPEPLRTDTTRIEDARPQRFRAGGPHSSERRSLPSRLPASPRRESRASGTRWSGENETAVAYRTSGMGR